MMVLVQIGEGGETVGGRLFGLATAVHLGVDREGAFSRVNHLALEGDDVAGENGEFEIDAVEYKEHGVLGVNVLCHSEIGAFQKPLGASSSEKGLVVVKVGELDQALRIGCFHGVDYL